MTARKLAAKVLATGLILSLQMFALPVFAETPTATLSGTILSGAENTPLENAKLHVGDPSSGRVFSSVPSGLDGAFQITDLPPATYELAVEREGGLFLVGSTVALAPGTTQNLNVAIQNAQMAPKPGTAGKAAKIGSSFWNNPLTAALIVLGAAVVLGVAINEATKDDPPLNVSPAVLP